MREPRIRILLADDHAMIRSGLRALLEREDDFAVVGEAGNGLEALDLVGKLHPDVIVLDITMPALDGIEAASRIHEAFPDTRILILTMHQDAQYLGPALKAGAAGYVVKRAADTELIGAIRAVHRGEKFVDPSMVGFLVQDYVQRTVPQAEGDTPKLSERETAVLRMMAAGFAYKEIADRLGISTKTVETYRERIKEKLGLSSRSEIVRFALEQGILHSGS
ncbi:MAG: response regulator transcription factor [Candidatus Sericytochromatia bacterium]|nr:response regulator transcription factor [Candidatus Tanganyikabacteria bacterium]